MKQMFKYYSLVGLFLLSLFASAQEQANEEQQERMARQDMREANKLYNQLKFDEAEIMYKKALSKNPDYPNAAYNLGNTIYQQNRNEEAATQFDFVRKSFKEKMSRAEAFHNMGNAFMQEKKYQPAIEAFKNSLRNNSKDEETRYNLALAQELLEEQQKDNKGGNDDKKNQQDKNKDDKGGDQENKDDQKENDKKEDGDKDKENDKKDQGDQDKKNDNKNQDKKDQEKKEQQPRPNKLSPEQMKQLLEAMSNEENKTQKKLNVQKAKGKKIKQEKDW